MHSPSRYARAIVLACHLALAVTLPLVAGVFGAVLVLPLLAIAPGLWRGTPRHYAGATLLLVFYAGGGLMEAMAHAVRSPGAIAVACLAVLEFCALMMFVRLRAAEARRP